MRVASIISAFVLACVGPFAPSAWTQLAPATDAQTAAKYAHAAEAEAVGPMAALERRAAAKYIEDDHTTHVVLCLAIFKELQGSSAKNAHEVLEQFLASAGTFLYEHPDAGADMKAQNVAGLDAALNVYNKFLSTDPGTKSKFLDGLNKDRNKGELAAKVGKMCGK